MNALEIRERLRGRVGERREGVGAEPARTRDQAVRQEVALASVVHYIVFQTHLLLLPCPSPPDRSTVWSPLQHDEVIRRIGRNGWGRRYKRSCMRCGQLRTCRLRWMSLGSARRCKHDGWDIRGCEHGGGAYRKYCFHPCSSLIRSIVLSSMRLLPPCLFLALGIDVQGRARLRHTRRS